MISIPFSTCLGRIQPIVWPRRRPFAGRIVTPRFSRDVDELRTWDMDIRQVLIDNAIRDGAIRDGHLEEETQQLTIPYEIVEGPVPHDPDAIIF